MPLIYMGDTQENEVTPQNGPVHHLKYHLQLMTKEDIGVGGSYGR